MAGSPEGETHAEIEPEPRDAGRGRRTSALLTANALRFPYARIARRPDPQAMLETGKQRAYDVEERLQPMPALDLRHPVSIGLRTDA
jgi:hypothetical protein